jgi:hypothetical protein
MTMTTPTPKRRWFQYSLRTLLVFVTRCAVARSWLAVKLQQARRQREVVAEIRKVGAVVYHDWESDGNLTALPNPHPPWPKWLRSLLGDDFFQSVIQIYFYTEEATDAEVEHLRGLSQLKELELGGTHVTDAGLEHLRGMSRLTELDLGFTQVTDAGLGHLKGLSQLQYLDLRTMQVTDGGVKRLQQALPNCEIVR